MLEHFKNITEKEAQLVVDSIAYITILIAGSDGQIDPDEKEWAEKITKIRSYTLPTGLKDYYALVGEHYQERLNTLIADLPISLESRKEEISRRLSELNIILPKLNRNFAIQLVESFRSFAKHVAESSGGFLGFASIDSKERELIGLEMIKYA